MIYLCIADDTSYFSVTKLHSYNSIYTVILFIIMVLVNLIN